MIYLDNAATSFPKPPSVTKEVVKCLKHYCGNPGRSSHKMAIMASEKIYEARERISGLVGFNKPENVVFCQNATYGLNLVIKALVDHKCHVVISDLEHNSVIRPLYKAIKQHGGEISSFNSDFPADMAIEPLIKPSTELIICTLASNVTGKKVNHKKISEIARKHNIKLVYDASQLLGHSEFNINESDCDYLIAPGHKALFGLQGSGFVVFKNDKLINTLTEGGSGYDTLNTEMPSILPERYEAGTLSTPAIAALSEGIRFISSIGLFNIEKKLNCLTDKCIDTISEIKEIKIYGADSGIVCFNVGSLPSSFVADELSKANIDTRSGLHCAPQIHRKLGTINTGAVRVSFSYFNNFAEIDKLYLALKKISTTHK